jgi:hypothetical protein
MLTPAAAVAFWAVKELLFVSSPVVSDHVRFAAERSVGLATQVSAIWVRAVLQLFHISVSESMEISSRLNVQDKTCNRQYANNIFHSRLHL